MADPTSPPDASPKLGAVLESTDGSRLHLRMQHREVSKLTAVEVLLALGILIASIGVAWLLSIAAALCVFGALLIASGIAAYCTLEDE
jgi:hypothetical protein